MNIEAMVRWTEVQMKSHESQEDYVKRLVDGEQALPQVNVKYDYSPMVFNIHDVSRFNKANDAEHTTLRFKDGDTYVIKVPYERMMELWIECTGRTILSLLSERLQEEKPKNPDINDLGI